jgi:hypothetical protein
MRFVSWSLPGPDTKDAMWTLETHLYGRTALHIGPATMYLGLTLGLDTNYVHAVMGTKSATNTTVGVGVNLQTGISIVATPVLSLELGGDYHPGTDTISDLAATPTSVSYWGLRIGTTIRL